MTSPVADIQDFETDLRGGDPQDSGFFARVIARAPDIFQITLRELAEILEVSPPSVTRWAQGRSMPHPTMRKAIIGTLLERIKKLGNSRGRRQGQVAAEATTPRRTPLVNPAYPREGFADPSQPTRMVAASKRRG